MSWRVRFALVLAASLGALGACDGEAALEDRDWTLVALGGEPVSATAHRPAPNLRLVSDDGQMRGFAGCNRMFGDYTLEGTRLEFGPVGATRMACSDAPSEPAFMAALAATKAYELAGSVLLFKDGATVLARFEATQPD